MNEQTFILGIETSCDETSVAVRNNNRILSNIVSSQIVHQKYGGVVPELASRTHQKLIIPIVNEALQKANIIKNQLSGIAVAVGPGLMGSLLVGVNFGKSLAYGLNIPFISVNHMEAHIYSNFIEPPIPEYPFLNLTVSGGHTQLVLLKNEFDYEIIGETRDDAAGEAFDKVAKMLGLGYPGGPLIDKLAKEGNATAIDFPRSFLEEGTFDFSFSGIKTSVLYYLRSHNVLNSQISHQQLADICASFQSAVVDVLVGKTFSAAKKYLVKGIAVAGGVSANSGLRNMMKLTAEKENIPLYIPKFEYCTDNGAMIAEVGYRKYLKKIFSSLEETAVARLGLEK